MALRSPSSRSSSFQSIEMERRTESVLWLASRARTFGGRGVISTTPVTGLHMSGSSSSATRTGGHLSVGSASAGRSGDTSSGPAEVGDKGGEGMHNGLVWAMGSKCELDQSPEPKADREYGMRGVSGAVSCESRDADGETLV